MSISICCVTGHRNIPSDRVEYVKDELKKEIMLAIEEGCVHFISGFANGVDLYFAEIIAEIKKTIPGIFLELAVPYRGRLYNKDRLIQSLIKEADCVNVITENYALECYDKRNRYMVDKSEMIIAVFNGEYKSGTGATIRYARKKGRPIHIINP